MSGYSVRGEGILCLSFAYACPLTAEPIDDYMRDITFLCYFVGVPPPFSRFSPHTRLDTL
jgi:hypothetical protein